VVFIYEEEVEDEDEDEEDEDEDEEDEDEEDDKVEEEVDAIEDKGVRSASSLESSSCSDHSLLSFIAMLLLLVI
jgi:hypothetical protein